jgi:iron complex transport system ATP-binding protein
MLLGPNGSGKSTFLRSISGVLGRRAGAVFLDNQELARYSARELARTFGVLEQESAVGFDFTVRELAECGRIPHRRRLASWTERDQAAVDVALQETGTAHLADRTLSTLSGGERQRAFFAMALAQEPTVLLLDEPTAHLDLEHQLDVLTRIRTLARNGLTVGVAIHDLNLASRFADRVAVLSQGVLLAVGSPRSVLTRELIRRVWNVDVEIFSSDEGPVVVPRTGSTTQRSAEREAQRQTPFAHGARTDSA